MIDKDLLKRNAVVYAVGYNSFGKRECVKCVVLTDMPNEGYLLKLHTYFIAQDYYLFSYAGEKHVRKVYHISDIYDNPNACCNTLDK
jgi:hypothetical protein